MLLALAAVMIIVVPAAVVLVLWLTLRKRPDRRGFDVQPVEQPRS
jgi:hypothetical protein